MRDNGPKASLFPRSAVLHVFDRLIAAPFGEALGLFSITMTVPPLNAAQLQMFLMSASKACELREVLADPDDSTGRCE